MTPYDPENYVGLFAPNPFPDVSGELSLTANGPGIGLAPPPPPPTASPPATPPPTPPTPDKGDSLKNLNPIAKLGLMLQAFGAGARGQPLLIQQLQQQELLKRKERREEMLQRLETANTLTKTAANLRGKERERFVESAVQQFAGDDPDFGEFLRGAMARPDLLKTLPVFAQRDPILKQLADSGDTKAIFDYLKSEAGRKHWNQISIPEYVRQFTAKAPAMLEWHMKNNREEYEKIVKDGELTIAEFRRLHDALPIQLQTDPEVISALTAPENQEALQGVMGNDVRIVTDEAAQKRAEAELTGQHQTEIQKLQRERDVLEERLETATGVERTRIERRIGEINDVLKKRGTIVGRTEFDVTKPTTTFTTELQRQIQRDDEALAQIDTVLGQLKGDPARGIPPATDATGVVGFAKEFVGGLAEQIPGIGQNIAEMLNSRDVTRVRTGIRLLIGAMVSRVTGDTSGRYSDRDVALVMEVNRGLKPESSWSQTVEALETVRDVIARGRIRSMQRLRGETGTQDIPAPKSKADYDQLPSGTRYRHPDGSIKVKP